MVTRLMRTIGDQTHDYSSDENDWTSAEFNSIVLWLRGDLLQLEDDHPLKATIFRPNVVMK